MWSKRSQTHHWTLHTVTIHFANEMSNKHLTFLWISGDSVTAVETAGSSTGTLCGKYDVIVNVTGWSLIRNLVFQRSCCREPESSSEPAFHKFQLQCRINSIWVENGIKSLSSCPFSCYAILALQSANEQWLTMLTVWMVLDIMIGSKFNFLQMLKKNSGNINCVNWTVYFITVNRFLNNTWR